MVVPIEKRSSTRVEPRNKTFANVIKKNIHLMRDAVWLQLRESEEQSREKQFRFVQLGSLKV